MRPNLVVTFVLVLFACREKIPSNHETVISNAELRKRIQVQWLKNVKTTGRISSNHYSDIVVDSAGNSYIACFATTADRTDHIYLAKVSPDGQVLWAVNDNEGRACAIALDQDENIWVTGFFNKGLHFNGLSATDEHGTFLAKFDPSGKCLQLIVGTGESIGFNCFANAQGEVLLTGTMESRLRFGNQELIRKEKGTVNFIALFDSQGNCQWIQETEGLINRIAGDQAGNFYLTGTFNAEMHYNLLKINTTGAYDNDAFLLKINTKGEGLWLKQFGNPGITRSGYRTSEGGFDLLLKGNGHILVATTTEVAAQMEALLFANNGINVSLKVLEITPDGALVQERTLVQNIRESTPVTLCQTSDGRYFVSFTSAGQSQIGDRTLQFNTDHHGVIAAFDDNWYLIDILFAANNDDAMYRESYAADSSVFFTGHFRGDMTLQNQSVQGFAQHSLFLLKIK